METPSSARRITRSNAAVASANSRELNLPFRFFLPIDFNLGTIQIKCKQDDSLYRARTRNGGERPVLLDVTNESPVVGLASGGFLPAEKSGVLAGRRTPGSGEEVLRGQVWTLLRKVEEEAEHPTFALGQLHRPSPPPPLFHVLSAIVKSPQELLAPTPANTPQIPGDGDFALIETTIASSRILSQNDHRDFQAEEMLIAQECQLNRALTFDSPEKSDLSDDISTISSSLTYECGSICLENSREDDNSSAWSIQVNVSTNSDTDDDEEDVEEGEEGNPEESLDDLCESLKKMRVEDEKPRLPEFAGKHTRFLYNSDDEIEGEEAVGEWKVVSPSVVVLKGLPVPEGTHLRFQEEDEEE
ncbi:hypothetical protein ZIOFF_021848 [Zingiber officinale]|uniref:Uncharacterized protein n=1 Tax=Zingiber officinale TaxID=94328 RepID=A0A8J5LJS8_ZINOF|nr:hypothetical protein ZIOFF_021848 [Zingiber officinale]